MSALNYYLVFGSGNPSDNSGLAPTFTSFLNSAGSATTAPAISEINSTGIYTFSYEAQGSINFIVDGATTGLADTDRYITGSVDIDDRNSDFILGLSASIGTPSDAIGDTSTAPTTVFGFLSRVRNWLEGESTYTVASGVLATKDTSGNTTLSSRTITNNGSTIDRT